MRQRYRQNTPASTPEEYYRTTLVIPYIDELMLIAPLNDRFTGLTKVCSEGLYLIPHVITQSPDPFKLDEVMQFSKRYEVHLPSPRGLNIELELWEAKWRKAQHDGLVVPSTANESLKMCRKNDFPNIYTMLKILCTIGVTSCEDERANSELTYLKTYLRSTMRQERLNGLALMHIHYKMPIDLEQIVDAFARKHPRRLQLNDMLH